MSDMVPEVLNAALDSLFTPKEPGELEYQGDDGLLYCRNCHTPVQCRVTVSYTHLDVYKRQAVCSAPRRSLAHRAQGFFSLR